MLPAAARAALVAALIAALVAALVGAVEKQAAVSSISSVVVVEQGMQGSGHHMALSLPLPSLLPTLPAAAPLCALSCLFGAAPF